jgi:hypothetical protein
LRTPKTAPGGSGNRGGKHSQEWSAELQIPPLRFAPVGMTKGRAALPFRFDTADAEQQVPPLRFASVGMTPLFAMDKERSGAFFIPVAFLIGHPGGWMAEVLTTLRGNLRVQGESTMWVEDQRPRRSYTGSSPMPRRHLSVIPAGTRPSLFGGD